MIARALHWLFRRLMPLDIPTQEEIDDIIRETIAAADASL